MEIDSSNERFGEMGNKKPKLILGSGDEVPMAEVVQESNSSLQLTIKPIIISSSEIKHTAPVKPRVLDKVALQKLLDHLLRVINTLYANN